MRKTEREKVACIWVANRHPFLLLFFPLHIQIHTSTSTHATNIRICIAQYTNEHPCIHTSTSQRAFEAPENIFIEPRSTPTPHIHTFSCWFALSPSLLLGALGGKYLARQSQAIIIFYSEHHRCRLFHCCCCCRYRYYHRCSRRRNRTTQRQRTNERASERENKGVYLNILNFCITKRGCEFV